MSEDNVTKLEDRRKQSMGVCLLTMPAPEPKPEGPFTVTVSDGTGKMFEIVFPDYTGQIPPDQPVLGSTFDNRVLCNLLAGAMRVYLGTT